MSNKKFNEFKSLFILSDIMPISMVLIGIIISLFISEIAIKLIGVSISILGIVVLLMKLTTRMSSSVETKFKSNPPPNFKITVKKSPEAVRQVIENYSGDIEDKETKSNDKEEQIQKSKSTPVKNTMGEEEGFRIISKNKTEVENQNEVIFDKEARFNTNELDSNEENVVPLDNSKIEKEEINNSEPNNKGIKAPTKFRKREINIPTNGLLEEMPILKEHPDKEFEFFINRILMAIRSVSNTRTAAYFFYNEHKNEIILNSFATESKAVINKKSKFIAGNDIVSQIARSMKPEILTDINPAAELDLLPYYESNSGTNSFIGIPVIYDKNVIGVLTADSKHSDAYDAVMVNFLSHFAKLISGLIRSYSDKYDLAQDSKYLKAYNQIDQTINLNDKESVHNELVSIVYNLFNAQNVYSISIENSKNNYSINAIASNDINCFEKGFRFSNNNSILSKCIANNEDLYTTNSNNEYIRIHEDEDKNIGYFYVVPINTDIESYGALAIEGKEGNILDKSERLFIKSLAQKASKIIENNRLLDLIKTGFDKDPESGLLTEKSIRIEIEKEICRNSKFKYISSLILVSFDSYKSIDDKDEVINEIILNHINNILDSTLNELDVRGMIDDKIIILQPGNNAQSAKLWAERIRNKIASESLYLDEKRYNITVSVGICELDGNSTYNSTIQNVSDALKVSKEKTNTVSVYS